MAVEPLKLPSDASATDKFPKKYISPTCLVRISAYRTGEPYFGKSGNNRFDAPGAATGTPEFGVCYLGTSLELAMAESILHDEIPVNGAFTITRAQIDGRFALYFGGKPLQFMVTPSSNNRWRATSPGASRCMLHGLFQQHVVDVARTQRPRMPAEPTRTERGVTARSARHE